MGWNSGPVWKLQSFWLVGTGQDSGEAAEAGRTRSRSGRSPDRQSSVGEWIVPQRVCSPPASICRFCSRMLPKIASCYFWSWRICITCFIGGWNQYLWWALSFLAAITDSIWHSRLTNVRVQLTTILPWSTVQILISNSQQWTKAKDAKNMSFVFYDECSCQDLEFRIQLV